MTPEIVCGQPILVPPAGSSPEKVQCYSDAAQWLRENCPGCGTSLACQAHLRALYMLWIMECDQINAAGGGDPDIVAEIRGLKRRYEEKRKLS